MNNTEIKTRSEINELLSNYVEDNCPNCFVEIQNDGRIHFDDKFVISHLINIIEILGYIPVPHEEYEELTLTR